MQWRGISSVSGTWLKIKSFGAALERKPKERIHIWRQISTKTQPRFPRKRVNINANFHFKRCLHRTSNVHDDIFGPRGKNLGRYASLNPYLRIEDLPCVSADARVKDEKIAGNLN